MEQTQISTENRRQDIISTRNMSKTYDTPEGKLVVLRDVNVQIFRNSRTAILGPSGSGKSTMINIFAALDKPDTGSEVSFDGKLIDFNDASIVTNVRRQVGLVFQSYNLVSHLSALDNIAVPLVICGWSWKSARSAAHKQLAAVGLDERGAFKPDQLSGGQQQRVGIARALVSSPKLIIADEPTGNLDIKSSQLVLKLFETCTISLGISVVIVTHDKQVASTCDQILEWRDGQFVETFPRRSVSEPVNGQLVGYKY